TPRKHAAVARSTCFRGVSSKQSVAPREPRKHATHRGEHRQRPLTTHHSPLTTHHSPLTIHFPFLEKSPARMITSRSAVMCVLSARLISSSVKPLTLFSRSA